MKVEDVVAYINEQIDKVTAQRIAELTERNELLERRIEALATEINILKEGGNI